MNLFSSDSIAQESKSEPLPIHLEMDIGILEFDPNYTLQQAKDQEVYPEVRKAEARRLPLNLKSALQMTDYWANIWIVPGNAITDIKVQGKIIESTGEDLKLHIQAQDASGRVLLDKNYQEEASEYDYSGGRKPFTALFERIAKDLQNAYRNTSHAKIAKMKTDTDIRFAKWVAPKAFSQHIDEQQKVISEPNPNSIIYKQALRLREHDALFFDKLQDYYDDFAQKTEKAHSTWLHESYLEISAKNKAQTDAILKGILSGIVTVLGVAALAHGARTGNSTTAGIGTAAALGGGLGVASSVQKYQASKIHDDAVRELADSTEISLKPHTLEIEGKKIQLEGSVEQQYLKWHNALQEQHRLESQQ